MTRSISLLLLCLVLAACQSDPTDSISLSEPDQAAAEQVLYPRFDLAHAAPRVLDAELQQSLDEILLNLNTSGTAESGESPFTLVITAEPDADAGCIAGGRLFVSEGLLAWFESPDEAAGVLAIAMQQCAQASWLWRERDDLVLVDFNPESELMYRYIDYRLSTNASLFNQAVASGCGEVDCLQAVSGRLEAAGYASQATAHLYARIRQDWPESAWLERVALEFEPAVSGPADPEWTAMLADYRDKRSGFADFAAVRRNISRGRFIQAYQASVRARRALGRTYETELMQAELDLHNKHGFYSRDILQDLENEYGEIAHASYYWGWVHSQANDRDLAREHLTISLEILPKVSAHHYLAGEMIHQRAFDQARMHLNHVFEASEQHRLHDEARLFMEIIDRSAP